MARYKALYEPLERDERTSQSLFSSNHSMIYLVSLWTRDLVREWDWYAQNCTVVHTLIVFRKGCLWRLALAGGVCSGAVLFRA